MKKTPPSKFHQSSQRKQNANLQSLARVNDAEKHNPKTSSALKSFKNAVKKCAQIVSLFLHGKRKSAPYAVGNDDRKNTSKVRGVASCKYDENRKCFGFWVILLKINLFC